jgi:hypothetical protein
MQLNCAYTQPSPRFVSAVEIVFGVFASASPGRKSIIITDTILTAWDYKTLLQITGFGQNKLPTAW